MPPDELTLEDFRALAADAGLTADDQHLADLYRSVVALRAVLEKLRAAEVDGEEPMLVFWPGRTP